MNTDTLLLFEVESPGLLTTVQDLGRFGQGRDGMPTAGAMDTFAASTANLLVGNARNAAVLEITLLGPRLRVLTDTRIALCGGDLSAMADGEWVPPWKTMTVRTGQCLEFGRRRSGARTYLAVSGGFAVPKVLGSRSTFLRGQIGGYAGRRLQAGDVLPGTRVPLTSGERGLRLQDIPRYDVPTVLRVLPGPHPASFVSGVWETFLASDYTLTPQSDRQGYRLNGPAVTRTQAREILSEAMPTGGLQVPPDGLPILLMADHQTTGGYPLIAVVISADLPRAAQLAPGDPVRFGPTTLGEAQAEAIAAERRLHSWEYAAHIYAHSSVRSGRNDPSEVLSPGTS